MSYRPDDLYFDNSQPYPSGPADPLPSSTWTCTTCNTTTHIFHRASHLLSRAHIRNSNSAATPPPPQRQTPSLFLWRCVPCGEEMHVFYRDEHIASKQHRKNTILANDTIPANDTFTCTTCSALVLLLDVASHLRTSPKWTCTSCDRVVHKSGMELHVAGCTTYSGDGDGGVALESDEDGGVITTHTLLYGGGEASVGPFLPAPPVPENLEGTRERICPDCSRMVLGRHLCVGMQCELCGMSRNRVDEAAHLNSTRHRMAVEKKEENEKLRQELEQTLQNRVDKPADVLPESVLPGPFKRTPSQPTNATAHIATVPKMWTCVMCFRTMATTSRGAHLQGIKHRNREQLQQKKTQDPAEKRSKQETKPEVHGKETWDCEVCVKTMSATSKESHLAGVKHRNIKLPAQEEKERLAAESRPDFQNGLEMPVKARMSRSQRISVRGSEKKVDAEAMPEGRQVQAENEEVEYKTHEVKPSRGTKHPRNCRICARVVLALSKLNPVAVTIYDTWDDEQDILENTSQKMNQWGEQPRVALTLRITPDASPRTTPRPGAESDPADRRAGISSRRGKIQKVDVYYCQCGRKILGTWCTDCDFRADAGWGKKRRKF